MSGWQASFGGCCKLAWVLPCDRCSPQGNGRKSRCRRPPRGEPHRRAQAASLHSAHWVGSVGQDVFVIGHRIHVLARFEGPRSRVRRGAGRGQRRRAVPLAQVAQDFFVHRDRWLRGREDSVRPVLTENSVKSFLKNIYTRRCSRTTARFSTLPELCAAVSCDQFFCENFML